VVRLRPGATTLEDLIPLATTVSPGGLALSADGRILYVADWGYGLGAIELASGSFEWMKAPPFGTMLGIDGLIRDGDGLIGIQNGVTPPRIARFTLSRDGRALTNMTLLERALPTWSKPTLGLIVGSSLTYVATSFWPLFPEGGTPPAHGTHQPTEIRQLLFL
jgi:sugar lactone lactonase YvrE